MSFPIGHIPWNKGVNHGLVPWNKGRFGDKRTDETKKKMSVKKIGNQINLGRIQTPDHRRKISAWGLANSERMKINGIKGVIAQKQRSTKPEILLSKILDENKINHISQYLINDKFLVDEYLPDYNLVIEVDGLYWHSLDGVIKKDKAENAYLKKCGFKMIRLPEDQISSFAASQLSEIMAVEGRD